MIAKYAYRRMVACAETVNQLNRLHILLERRLLPAEQRDLVRFIRADVGVLSKWIVDARPFRSMIRRFLLGSRRKSSLDIELLNWGTRWTERIRKLPDTVPDVWVRSMLTRGYGLYQKGDQRSRKLLVGWTGRTHLMMLPTPDFLRAMSFLDADILILWPRESQSFLEGIPGLGSTFADSVESLSRMIEDWGYAECITMGASGGALPALEASLDLGATHVYLLGPGNPVQKALSPWPELVEAFKNLGESKPVIHIAAGIESAPDIRNAQIIADNCGATVFHVHQASHGILYSLFQSGNLIPWLKDFIGHDTIPRTQFG